MPLMSALDFISGLLTPSYLFLFLNLVIGTIFITSRLGSQPHPHPQAPLARAPSSLIDRVRSINLSLYKFDSHPGTDPVHDYPEPDRAVNGAPLSRTPSLLERFRSINFYQHKFEHPNPELEPVHPIEAVYDSIRRESPPLYRAPSLLDRLKSISFYHQKFDQPTHPEPEATGPVDPPDLAPPARSPSLLERVSSINFPSLFMPGEADPSTEPRHDDRDHLDEGRGHVPVRRIRSESERMGEGPRPRMRKTASEKSAAELDEEEEGEEINAKADDFIQRFKQQLRLQRLDSLMRYKEMLTGGAAR